MEPEKDKPIVVLVKLLVAVMPAFYFMYQENQKFQWTVDQAIANLRYRLALNSWKGRVWHRLSEAQRALYVEKHGSPE